MPEPTLDSESHPHPFALPDPNAHRISSEQMAAVARLQDYWRSRNPATTSTSVAEPATDEADSTDRPR